MERTLIVLKPDAVQRSLVGRIVARFEQKGLRIVAMKMMNISAELAREMYSAHEGKDFYEPLIEFVTDGAAVAMVVEGKSAIDVTRAMMGPTFGPDAPPGTIRGDFGISRRYNLLHGSDSLESAQREIGMFFRGEELIEYDVHNTRWIYAKSGDELI